MKLVFIIENPEHVGGGNYSIFKFAEFLAKRGHEVTVFARNKNAFYKDYEFPENLRLHYRGSIKRYFKGIGILNKVYSWIYEHLVIRPFLKRSYVDYVIGYLTEPAIKAVKLGKRFDLKVCNFVFESPPWMEKDLGNRWRDEYQGWFKKMWEQVKEAYKESDILLGNSILSQKECSSWINKPVKGYVYPGIDLEMADSIKVKNIKRQMMYIGRLNEYKNLDTVLQALKLMKNPPKFVIAGDGSNREDLEQLAEKLDVDVDFLGPITDKEKFKLIKESKMMVFPSSHEGFGMPPMEALYCERPCLCSDKAIFKEVYGNQVEYFRERDPESMAVMIKKILESKKDWKTGRKYVKSKFSWERSAKRIEKYLS